MAYPALGEVSRPHHRQGQEGHRHLGRAPPLVPPCGAEEAWARQASAVQASAACRRHRLGRRRVAGQLPSAHLGLPSAAVPVGLVEVHPEAAALADQEARPAVAAAGSRGRRPWERGPRPVEDHPLEVGRQEARAAVAVGRRHPEAPEAEAVLQAGTRGRPSQAADQAAVVDRPQGELRAAVSIPTVADGGSTLCPAATAGPPPMFTGTSGPRRGRCGSISRCSTPALATARSTKIYGYSH